MAPLPLLFMLGTSLVRAATPAIARQMAKKLPKPTVKQARQKITQTINNIKAVDKLKPSTKVVGKKKGASTKTGSPSPAPKPKPAGLKPTRNPALAKAAKKTTKKPIDKGKSIATGTVLTVATLPLTMKKDKSVKAENTSAKKDSGAKQYRPGKGAKPNKAKETKTKTFRDVFSVQAAQNANPPLNYFTDRKTGKKKIAITKEQLQKKYPNLSPKEALRKHANSIRGKK